MSKKQQVLTELFRQCQKRRDFVFTNEMVKTVAADVGFKNPFDVTKVDNSSLLPPILVENDRFVLHLGKGRHCFVRGIANGYHAFETITDKREWECHA